VAGHRVRLTDSQVEVRDNARRRIEANLELLISRDLLTTTEAAQALTRIRSVETIPTAVADAEVVIEAVYEDLGLKHAVLAEIEASSHRETLITSNTSNFQVAELALAFQHPERFLITHFWSPPHIIPLVEVVRGASTADQAVERVSSLLRDAGKHPALVRRDVAGFVGNRLQHALRREAIAIVDQGIASPEDVDLIARLSFGLRLPVTGPLETVDLGGLDLSLAIQTSLLPHLDRSTEPTALLRHKVSKGDLGVKTGRGFFKWTEERHRQRVERRDRALLDLIELLAAWDAAAEALQSAD
jgi:3-hydroxybutyryl-CoA dehydrogenase